MYREGIGLYKGRRCDTGGYIEGYLVVLSDPFHNGEHYICPKVLIVNYDMDNNDYKFGPFYKVDASTVTQLWGGKRMKFFDKIAGIIGGQKR